MSTAAIAQSEELKLSTEILSGAASMAFTPGRLVLSKGDLISLQDGRGAGVHVLMSGRVKILRFSNEGKVMLLDLLEPGDVLGEISGFSAHGVSQSYAEAVEPVELLTIPRLSFERLLRHRPALALSMARLLVERCNRLEQRLESQVFDRVPTRLAQQLLELAERYGERDADGTFLSIPLSQQDLGNLIGASREIVSLTLSDFRRRGLLSTRGRRLVVREQALLDELGAGRS